VDSAGSTAREGLLAPGRVRAIPIRGGIGFMQPKYRWRPLTVPTLSRIALFAGDSARSVLPTAGLSPRLVEPTPVVAGDLRGTVASLYAAMRSALQRGDWVAFGRAFDALGVALGKRPAGASPP
jgi:hypothetical protein